MTARRCAKVLAGGFQVSWLACCEGRPDIAVAGFLFERMCLLPAFVLWQLPLVGCWAVVGLSCRFLYMRCCHVSQQRFNDDNMLITDRHLFCGWYNAFRNNMMHFCRQYLRLLQSRDPHQAGGEQTGSHEPIWMCSGTHLNQASLPYPRTEPVWYAWPVLPIVAGLFAHRWPGVGRMLAAPKPHRVRLAQHWSHYTLWPTHPIRMDVWQWDDGLKCSLGFPGFLAGMLYGEAKLCTFATDVAGFWESLHAVLLCAVTVVRQAPDSFYKKFQKCFSCHVYVQRWQQHDSGHIIRDVDIADAAPWCTMQLLCVVPFCIFLLDCGLTMSSSMCPLHHICLSELHRVDTFWYLWISM